MTTAGHAEPDASASAASTSAASPSGWHPDPLGGTGYRYWDGLRWSPYGSPDGTTVVVDADDRLPDVAPTRPDSKRALAFLASLVGLGAVAAFAIWRAGPDEGTDPFAFDSSPVVASEGSSSDPPPDSSDPTGEAVAPKDRSTTDDDDPFLDSGRFTWPEEGEPVKVVYLYEESSGDEWEEIIVSDPPRAITRGPFFILYNDGTDVVRCIEDRCVLLDSEWDEPFDYIENRRSYQGPSELEEPFARRIAGRDAICTQNQFVTETTCWDTRTGVMLLLDPGDEAMEPSAFSSTRITATYLGPPEDGDFDLPSEILPPEEPPE